MQTCNKAYASACGALTRTLAVVKAAIKSDRAAYYTTLGAEAQDALDNGNMRAAFKTVRQLMPGESLNQLQLPT